MSKQRNRSAKPLRAVRGGSRSRKTGARTSPIYSSPRIVMPAEFTTKLVYSVLNTVTNVAGFAASIRFGTNAYDVDPALGSTAMPGFAEFAGFYSRFRTMAIGYEFSVANEEAFSLTIVHGFSNSVIASGSFGLPYAGNPLMHSTQIGPLTGLNLKTLRGHKTVTAITGTQQPLFDDLYTGSTTSSTLPTASTKWCYCAFLSSQPLTAVGALVTARITLTVKFYLPNLLLV
jgi:hypothetical protein